MKWAPNPYAIAQLLTGEPDLEPRFTQEGERVDDFLKKALLSHKQKTMTTALAVFQKAAEVTGSMTLADAMASPFVREAADEYSEDKILGVLPALLSISDATFDGHLFEDSRELIVEEVTYLDPVQGQLGDCYLMAAMIALAWAKPQLVTARVGSCGFTRQQPAFAWSFYNDEGSERSRVSVSGRVPTAGKLPRYARSSSRDEYLPALLEKACVANKCPATEPASEPSPADYQSINVDMSPPLACQALVGGQPGGRWLKTRRGSEVFAERDQFGESGPLYTRSGAMSKPVMAWTLEERGPADPEYWEKTGLFANHAYAVLGVIGNPNHPDHVVLRNPHGFATTVREGYAEGHWRPDERSPVELNRNGVIAISHALFFEHFEHIGWVDLEPTQPPS